MLLRGAPISDPNPGLTDHRILFSRVRALCLGGSNYRPSGSHWYFPNQIELNTHNKYFLMDDTYERAGTISFRCVVDAN